MKLSIVSTLYQSALYIEEFCKRAQTSAQKLVGENYEIVLVNDGSQDKSLEIAVNLANHNPHIIVIDLSRNFGHHKAMMTGLANSRGELVFLIDSDLEEDPDWLIPFEEKMAETACDVVYGVQITRKGGLFERSSGFFFYHLFRALTKIDLPQNLVTARLMTRRYVEALLLHREREIVIGGLWMITGFYQEALKINKISRLNTTYTFRKKMSALITSVTSFSNMPLKGIFYIGMAISFFASLYFIYLILNRIVFSTPLSGWTSVIASIWLLGGMTISFLGIVGIYLSKIYIETKRRPYTIIRQIYGRRPEDNAINNIE